MSRGNSKVQSSKSKVQGLSKELTLWERQALAKSLPVKATRAVGRIIESLRKRLAVLDAKDEKAYGLKRDVDEYGKEFVSDYDAKAVAPFRFTQMELDMIAKQFRDADKSGGIPTTEGWGKLYDKFVGEESSKSKVQSPK